MRCARSASIPNRPEAVRRLVRKLGPPEQLRVCYEAGPTGYVLYWQLIGLGVHCDVVAPSLVPVKAGDRVKTDRRDAEKLARSYRAGDLTPVWVPDAEHEALRDLVRAREAAKKDQLRARHRLGKFLLRHGRQRPAHLKTAWTAWPPRLDPNAPLRVAGAAGRAGGLPARGRARRRSDRGPEQGDRRGDRARRRRRCARSFRRCKRCAASRAVSAATIVAEVGQLSRFQNPRQLMGYSGLVPSEYTTGARRRPGAITKTGNAHLRRVVIEAAWAYRFGPAVRGPLRARQAGLEPGDHRDRVARPEAPARSLSHAGRRKGKNNNQVITAVGRELLGFIWDIARTVERPVPIAAQA